MIATLRAKVAKDRGVDPESLEAEVVNVGQEDGKGFIDIRFTTKETTTAPDAVMSAMETETSPLPDAVAAAWSVEQDPPTVEVHRPRR